MKLRKGIQPGTIVTDYEPGAERPYMIKHYGGRLVASGMSEADIDSLVSKSESIEYFDPKHIKFCTEQRYTRSGEYAPVTEVEFSQVAFRRHGAFRLDALELADIVDVVNCILVSRLTHKG